MSEYSGYKIKRPHALGPFASLYEATAADGGPGRFALKIFHPPPSTNIRRSYAIEGWLFAAERQKDRAQKDGAVLAVLACGRCPEGAYAVMPWEEHSLEPLIGTLQAKGDILRALAECLLNTLEQWVAQTGGSHRKLKPTNIFLQRSGPLAGMTAIFSDPWFMYGDKQDTSRTNDLSAIGAILAQIVRRREVAAWPIEDAPEWKTLGRPGKAWLEFCNYLLNPQPAAGELTIAEARKRLRAIPQDARPVRNAILIGTAAVLVIAAGVLAFARFGDPAIMPPQIRKLAETNWVHNPRAFRETVTANWAKLCHAWDTWLGDLQNNAPRMLKTEGLWSDSLWADQNDPLHKAIKDFGANAKSLLPGTVVPEAAGEKRLGVLGDSPSPKITNELKKTSVSDAVDAAYARVSNLALQLETWPRWNEMRTLLALLQQRGFNRAAAALDPRLPPKPGSTGYHLDAVRTLKVLNDLSLDDTGALLLASRWGEMTGLKNQMETSNDRIQKAMPVLILTRLADRSSIGDFADSLGDPLDEMKRHRQQFLDPQVVRERFLKESTLQAETVLVTVADFPRWEQELVLFSKVPVADDPRLAAELDVSAKRLPTTAVDLEADAPAAEPGGLPTLSAADFKKEFDGLTTNLKTLRGREIVRHDLPTVSQETTKLAGVFRLLEQRLETTLALLKPQIWLGKVTQPYGNFRETKQRWAAWQQAALTGVTAASLEGSANRPRFRALRAQVRQVREWIDGLEGPDGLGALAVPDLSAASPDTGTALRQLESTRREDTATAAAGATTWTNALPQTTWAAAGAAVRAPLQAHREWLADLPAFGGDLDRLGTLLEGGFSWNEGVSAVMEKLARHLGLDALTGRPAEWNTEAKLLRRLVESSDRAELVAAAQSGGLSRKFTAWRRLGTLSGWPANAADLDIDGAVVARLREDLGRDVKDESRRGTLRAELTRETRGRWNRAARNSASDEKQITTVFERMERYGIGEADLEAPALYNLKLWQLKRSDWSEVDLGPLRRRRDAFVGAVRAIPDITTHSPVKKFVDELAGIELIVDPNRAPTPSPRLVGWQEELTDAGLGLTATWNKGGKTVKLDFSIVQPKDDSTPPFYLARREIAVGEFLDLLATRPKEGDEVVQALPVWARGDSYAKPYNKPMVWRPRVDNSGKYYGIELNPVWISYPTSDVKGLLDDADLRAKQPALDKVVSEKPTLRSPLQQVPPDAARLFAEKVLGARLPTPKEWQAVMQLYGPVNGGNFRGATFKDLWAFIANYHVAGQSWTWRPSEGVFLPRKYVDDGVVANESDQGRLWFVPVDEGPVTGGFVNLTGNVSIYLCDPAVKPEPQFYAAGGSVLSPPGVDFTQPQKVEAAGLIGAKKVTEGFSDVGIRPAFDAPPGFRERYKLLLLVREQAFLTW